MRDMGTCMSVSGNHRGKRNTLACFAVESIYLRLKFLHIIAGQSIRLLTLLAFAAGIVGRNDVKDLLEETSQIGGSLEEAHGIFVWNVA